jgi:hypothetical protein
MTTSKVLLPLLVLLALLGCKKSNSNTQMFPIPNGNFENWTNESLLDWQTNSCPAYVPPYETYVVQKITDSYSGKFAAKFIYNKVYKSWAYNKFSINDWPAKLIGYVRSKIANADTVMIQVALFSGTDKIESGNWYGTSSIVNYKKIEIPLSSSSSPADSASIKIVGGGQENTELYIDNLEFVKVN